MGEVKATVPWRRIVRLAGRPRFLLGRLADLLLVARSGLFNETCYAAKCPHLPSHRWILLLHYILSGAEQGLSPQPLFDPGYYLGHNPDLPASVVDPLVHYLRVGAGEGRDPNPLFDTSYYLERYPDVLRSGVNPLRHFLDLGAREGRDPSPLFDTSYYVERYGKELEAGQNPLEDFLRFGGLRGRDPNPLFDTAFYLERYADVAEIGANPLVHYLLSGANEGRNPHRLFDTRFYLENAPDVAAAGVNPLAHYLRSGGQEGRDPSPVFDTALYRREHPESLASPDTPLGHYLEDAGSKVDPSCPIADFEYQSWLGHWGSLSGDSVALVSQRLAAFAERPLISLIVAVSGSEAESSLREAMDSVRDEIYDRWELLLVAAPGAALDKAKAVAAASNLDGRARLVSSDTSDPAEQLNAGLGVAEGAFIAVLGSRDRLDPVALALVALALDRSPRPVVVYTDEDRLDANGKRVRPSFKPDWSEDLFYATGYLGRLTAIDRAVALELGGYASGYSPHHEYELLLRILERTDRARISHVPFVGAHVAGSLLPLSAEARQVAERALLAHFERLGHGWAVADQEGCLARPVPPLPEPLPHVTIVIPTRNRVELLRACVSSVCGKTDYPAYDVLIVDNESTDPGALRYLETLSAAPRVRVLRRGGPFDYAAFNNEAVREAAGEVLCFLNNDVEVLDGGWLSEMVRHLSRPDVAVVGARLLYPNGRIQHAGVILGIRGVAGHAFAGLPATSPGYMQRAAVTQEYSAVTAACMIVRRSTFEALGGFDAAAFRVNFNDVDFCLRVRASGLKVLYTPRATLVHHESASRRTGEQNTIPQLPAEGDRLRDRWGALLPADPFYNPNLDLSDATFRLAARPRERRAPGQEARIRSRRGGNGLEARI